jgi:hypothetical protein
VEERDTLPPPVDAVEVISHWAVIRETSFPDLIVKGQFMTVKNVISGDLARRIMRFHGDVFALTRSLASTTPAVEIVECVHGETRAASV